MTNGVLTSLVCAHVIQSLVPPLTWSKHIPVEHIIDSKTLRDSVFSTKPIEEKTTRHLLAWIKQQKEEFKNISKIDWIPNQQMLADNLTKKGVKADLLLSALRRQRLES